MLNTDSEHVNREQQQRQQSRYQTLIMINQAGHLSKISDLLLIFLHVQSANLIHFFSKKRPTKEERNKSLINSTMQSARLIKASRQNCLSLGLCIQRLASQAGSSHGNLEMEASRVGVVGGIE